MQPSLKRKFSGWGPKAQWRQRRHLCTMHKAEHTVGSDYNSSIPPLSLSIRLTKNYPEPSSSQCPAIGPSVLQLSPNVHSLLQAQYFSGQGWQLGEEEESMFDLSSNCQEVWRLKAVHTHHLIHRSSLLPVQERGRSSIRSSQTRWFCQSSAVHPGDMLNIPWSQVLYSLICWRKWCLIPPVCARHSVWHPPLEGWASLPYSSVTVSSLFLNSVCVDR